MDSSPPSHSWQLVGILWTPHEDLGSGETGQVWQGCDLVTRAPASHPSCSLTLGSMSVHPTGGAGGSHQPGCSCHLLWLFLGPVLSLTCVGARRLRRKCVTGLHSQLMLVSAVATPKSWQQLQTKSLLSPTNRNQGKKDRAKTSERGLQAVAHLLRKQQTNSKHLGDRCPTAGRCQRLLTPS